MIATRIERLLDFLEEQAADAIIINKLVNLHYFSGFRGDDTVLVLTKDKKLLITDARYTKQAEEQARGYELVEQTNGLWKTVAECLKTLGSKKIAFEGNALFYNDHASIAKLLPEAAVDVAVHLDALRQIKDEEEISCIRKACGIADEALDDVLNFIRVGMTEIEVAAHMEMFMRAHGSERPAFTTIVASGKRGALPHGVATEKVIQEGDFVTMDYGAVYQGYHSDMTRTVCMGYANEKQRRIYEVVLEAQQKSSAAIKVGVSGKAIDKVARGYIENAGFGKYFVHGLGHSLGLEIHEEPRLSRLSKCERLERNMLVTDEPGIYIPNFGGVRIEDTLLVTEAGAESLIHSKKDLIEIVR